MNSFFHISKFKDRGLYEEFTDDSKESDSDTSENNIENDTIQKNEIIINENKKFKNNDELNNNQKIDDNDYSQNNSDISNNEEIENTNEEEETENKEINTKKSKEQINSIEENKIYAQEDTIDVSKFDLIENPAIKYPFELDEFQKRSIIRLEQKQSVLVCAHTSSGKTVVAEYGIALGEKHSKRVIYTSPIKALSNQKYQDFKKRFNSVGILTGDVSINPDAQCLIMTTEILQGYLYKNHGILSQLEWIIFDEIHYINDMERGHVWEEILILLPPGINVIMLSATIPNYLEFAKWVGNIKKTMIYIEITLKRIVPLQHQIYIDSQNIYEIKSTDGKVYENKVREAMKYLKNMNSEEFRKIHYKNIKANEKQIKNTIQHFMNQKQKYFNKQNNQNFNNNNQQDLYSLRISKMHHKLFEIVDFLEKNSFCPAVIFVFSIKKITEYTRMLTIKNLLTDQEKSKVIKFFNEVITSKISKEDQEIPQIKETLEILKSGIGLHHAGLLPILKEIIEILYSQGLIKVLFATTSFSIGLNMPTRTVVFTEVYKFNADKKEKEILTSSDYLQMCGRAGRRGKDLKGNVFIILTDQTSKNQENELINMLKDEGTDVKSKFRLSYKTILSFSSRDKKGIQDFVQHSFLESEKSFLIPEKIKELTKLKKEFEQIKFKCKFNSDTINKSRKEIFEQTQIIHYISDDKKNSKEKEKEKKDEYIIQDIEDSPCKEYCMLTNQYNECNKNIFTEENFAKKIYKLKPGTILKVKERKEYHKKINKGNYVMLIHAFSPNSEFTYRGKFWCLWIKSYTKIENSNDIQDFEDDDDDLIFNGFETKETEKEFDKKIFEEENEYKGFKYYYKMYDIEDIINIYDTPNIKFKRENLIKHEDKFYFNHKKSFEKKILRELYFQIKDYFIEKNNIPNKLDYDYSKYITTLIQKNSLIQRNKIKNAAKNCLCCKCPHFKSDISKFYKYKDIKKKIDEINNEISPERMANYEEFIKRKNILKQLGYINAENNILTPKGKAAREISTTDCVIISEILLSDILQNLNDDELVAFLSCFATNKSEVEIKYPRINNNLDNAFDKFLTIYDDIKKIEKKNNFEENIYNRRFMPEAVEAIKLWMNGAPFGEICKMTDLEEGKLYNLISRIYLFLEELINFYVSLGIVKEGQRLENIKHSVLRGIMGVQSLYLQDNINFDLIK